MGKQLTGIKHVYENIPRVIQHVEMPALIVFPGEMDVNREYIGSDMIYDSRIYRCWLFIDEAQMGAEGQAEIAADVWFDRVRDHFTARPGLELNNATNPQTVVLDTDYEGDSGFTLREYGNKLYGVIEFRLRVNELASIAYQD